MGLWSVERRHSVDLETRLLQYRVLTMESPSVPNALAAMLLHVRDNTGVRPHIYFEWTEGNPALNFLRFRSSASAR